MPSFKGRNKKNNKSKKYSSIIRVGNEHQAITPDLLSSDCTFDCKIREKLVWSPDHRLEESQIEDFVRIAKEKHGYTIEQSYALLFVNNYDLNKSLKDLPLYCSRLSTNSVPTFLKKY